MAISFDKQVEIVNWRLDVLNAGLTFIVGVAIILNFFWANQYSQFSSVGDRIDVVLWVDGWQNRKQMEASVNQSRQALYCQDPERYDYWWDTQGLSRFDNHSCVDLCGEGIMANACVHPVETYYVHPNSVFLVTQMTATFIGGGTAEPINYFFPTIEAFRVGFTYSYIVPKRSFFDFDTPGTTAKEDDLVEHSCTTDVLTVVLDSQGREKYSLRPPIDGVYLTAEEILELAGHKHALDDVNKYAGENWLNGSSQGAGPIGRISGLQVSLQVECYNYRPIPFDVEWDNEHVCYVRVQLHPSGWSFLSNREDLNERGELRTRNMHGLRVDSMTGGNFQFPDWNNIILNLTAAIVMLRLVRTVMLYIAISCLGHVSKIYRRVIYESFELTEQVGGMATRLMTASIYFAMLEDSPREDQSAENIGGTISKERMLEQFKQIFRHHRQILETEEVETFVNFCFRSVVDIRFMGQLLEHDGWAAALDDKRSGIPYFMKKLLRGKLQAAKEVQGLPDMNIDSYCVSWTSSDWVSFDDIVKLFDQERKITFMERIFLPKDFKLAMRLAKKHAADKLKAQQAQQEQAQKEQAQKEQAQKEQKEHQGDSTAASSADPSGNLNRSFSKVCVESKMHLFEKSISDVSELINQEKSHMKHIEDHEAERKKMEARISKMEHFLEHDLADRVSAHEEEYDRRQEAFRDRLIELRARAEMLAHANKGLREQCRRITDKPDFRHQHQNHARHQQALADIAGLEARLLNFEEQHFGQPLQDVQEEGETSFIPEGRPVGGWQFKPNHRFDESEGQSHMMPSPEDQHVRRAADHQEPQSRLQAQGKKSASQSAAKSSAEAKQLRQELEALQKQLMGKTPVREQI